MILRNGKFLTLQFFFFHHIIQNVMDISLLCYFCCFYAIVFMVIRMSLSSCNLRRASATDALTSGRLAEQNGRPPDNPNSVLQLDHHDIMLGDPLEDCVSRYCIVHDHGLPFVWFPLGTDDRAP